MRAWDSLELELQVIVGSHVVAGNKTHSPSIFFFHNRKLSKNLWLYFLYYPFFFILFYLPLVKHLNFILFITSKSASNL